MASFRVNRLLPIILIVVVTIIAVAALVSIARAIFVPSSSTTSSADISQQALLSADSDRSVTMSVRGPIVADENFESYEMAITPNSRTLTTYNGYNKNVTGNISLGNSIPAYTQFVYALNLANFVKGTPLTGSANDTRGICATGELYTFDVLEGNQVIKELWTSSCSGSTGSLNADLNQIMDLFIAQIPNAQTTIDTTNL